MFKPKKPTPRYYQKDALNSFLNTYCNSEDDVIKGRFVMPTGAGKTFVEANTLDEMLGEGGNIHLVVAPRILLLQQLVNEYKQFINYDCDEAKYVTLAFHSGKHEPGEKVKWDEENTTRISTVKKNIERAKRVGKDLVIFSTYHSFHKLADAGIKFNLFIADESQYCVSKNYHPVVDKIDASVKLFFTATEKHTKKSVHGLNNEEVYGKVLYRINPKELIEGGYIVKPRLHIMHAKARSETSTVVDEVINYAKVHEEETKKSGMPFNKVLFACKGTKDVTRIVENIDRIKKEFPDHEIYTIISHKDYGAMNDGRKISRDEFLSMIKKQENALVFHYDILSEGIDVDGFTGCVVMRENMTKSKLLQTIGRVIRVYKPNPDLKKFALISVALIDGDDENKNRVSDIISQMRAEGYNVTRENVTITGEDGPGIGEDSVEDQYGEKHRMKPQAELDNIWHEIEEKEAWDRWFELTDDEVINDI